MQLLRKGGLLCYITSNKWMRAGYGGLLRDYFTKHTNPLHLLDFAGTQIFDSATVDTNILLVQKGPNQNKVQACVVGADFSTLENLSVYFQQRARPARFAIDGNAWVVLSPVEKQIHYKIVGAGTPLKDWNVQIYRGILTGFNDAFIIDEPTKNKLLKDSPKSAEIIRPMLRGRDIKRYRADNPNLWMIFTRRGVDIKKYPAIEAHLLKYYNDLKPKAADDKAGRKPGSYEWFEIQDNIAYYRDFAKEKIIYPEISKHQPFVLDTDGYYCNNKTFIITGECLEFLTAFFNSRLFRFCFLNQFPNLGDDRREMRKVFFEQISVKRPSESQQNIFTKAVAKMINLKSASTIVEVLKLEKEIDYLVYDFYGLTQAEIAAVEA